MKFFETAKSSLGDANFYKELEKKPTGSSVWYFVRLSLLLSLILTATTSAWLIPRISSFTTEAISSIAGTFPAELELKIEKGVASANVTQPYSIAGPGTPNFIVIDTTQEFSITQFDSYNTNHLLTKDALAIREKSGKITATPLAEFPDITLNQAKVRSWLGMVEPYLPLINPLVVGAIFFATVAYHLSYFLYFILGALIVMGVSRIQSTGLSFGSAYRYSIHLATLPILILLVIRMTGFGFGIPFAFTILFTISAFVNLPKKA